MASLAPAVTRISSGAKSIPQLAKNALHASRDSEQTLAGCVGQPVEGETVELGDHLRRRRHVRLADVEIDDVGTASLSRRARAARACGSATAEARRTSARVTAWRPPFPGTPIVDEHRAAVQVLFTQRPLSNVRLYNVPTHLRRITMPVTTAVRNTAHAIGKLSAAAPSSASRGTSSWSGWRSSTSG